VKYYLRTTETPQPTEDAPPFDVEATEVETEVDDKTAEEAKEAAEAIMPSKPPKGEAAILATLKIPTVQDKLDGRYVPTVRPDFDERNFDPIWRPGGREGWGR
jgi:hypothetical protein